MAVTIRNTPTNQNREEHPICKYFGFIDSSRNFFLITNSNTIVLMTEDFPTYNLNDEYISIEAFLEREFDTTLVQVYNQNDFDITIDLK